MSAVARGCDDGGVHGIILCLAKLKVEMSSLLRWLPPWELASIRRPPSGPAECPTCFLVGLQGSLDAMLCLLVCRFSDESLALVGDDDVIGIIFLVEGIAVITSSCRDIFR